MNKFYITTAIPYPNGKPHLGFDLEILITDVLARYHRLLGDEVYFLTGTDEHGLKVFQSAKKEGLHFQEYVDRNSAEFARLKEVLDISNDDFIRTTDKVRHWPGVEKLWNKALEAGKIYKKKYTGLYCVGCEEFKAEKDLENGLCPEHKVPPEKIEEENYFFKLSDFTEEIKQKIISGEFRIVPEGRKNEILSLLEQGAEDFSISRPSERISWGIPVPNDPSQTIYVWFDALTNYISALGYGRDEEEFKKWWPADIQVIGKGISRFHAIYWPAMLLAANLPVEKTLFIHGYVTVGGEKISKSLGNVVSVEDITQRYGPASKDALRYCLLRYISTTEDGNFSFEEFERVYNADLANGLGNLVARVAKLAEKINLQAHNFSGKVDPEIGKSIEEFKLNEALIIIWKKISETDKKINEQKPWELEEDKLADILIPLIEDISNIAYNLKPFLPETSEKILKQFSGSVKSAPPLFPRI